MAFDVEKLLIHCKAKIQEFARQQPDETFYAFAIDANMLCLNSYEAFGRTLTEYRLRWKRQTRQIESLSDMTKEDTRDEQFGLKLAEKYGQLDRSDARAALQFINEGRFRKRSEGCDYDKDDEIEELRMNTGDWAYQGFAIMEDKNGFDGGLYNDHYYKAGDSPDGHAPNTKYAIAMTELVNRLRNSDAFEGLYRSDDFIVTWVDHDY